MRRHVRWLYDELPTLVGAGVLTDADAERLREHYGTIDTADVVRRVAFVIFGVLGATLVGAGVILLVAHNWDDLSRPARAALSVGLLVVAQAVAGFAAWRHPRSAAWTEASASGLVLALGACLALISQTYHLEGDLHAFLATWLALALPAVYLLEARFAGVLWLAGVVGWAGDAPSGLTWMMLVWLLALAPFVAWVVVRGKWGRPEQVRREVTARDHLLGWASALTLLCSAFMLADVLDESWFLYPAGVFGALLATARAPWVSRAWRVPALLVGGVSGAVLLLALSWDETWGDGLPSLAAPGAVPVLIVSGLLLAVALVQSAGEAVAGRWSAATGAAVALTVLFGWALALAIDGVLSAIWVNAAVLVGGVALMADGLRGSALGRTNAGLALVSSLLVLRFFDADVSIVLRGFAFIALGIAFLGVNVRLLGRRGEASA